MGLFFIFTFLEKIFYQKSEKIASLIYVGDTLQKEVKCILYPKSANLIVPLLV